VAFSLAAEHTSRLHREQREARRRYHTNWHELLREFPRVSVFRSEWATPHILTFAYPPLPGEVILHHLEQAGLYVSTGAACSTRKREPSHAMLAAGMSEAEALSAVRLSFSVHNTEAGQARVFPAFRQAMENLAAL